MPALRSLLGLAAVAVAIAGCGASAPPPSARIVDGAQWLPAAHGAMRSQVLGAQGTAGIFATYPAPYLSTLGGFIDQVIGTALLVAMVFAISDERNAPPAASLAPVFVGLTVMAIGMALSVASLPAGACRQVAQPL